MSKWSEMEVRELDVALAADGQDITLRRFIGTTNRTNIDVQCRAFVRLYTPQQLTPNTIQGDTKVILSPTEIIAAQWPGAGQTPTAADARVPRKGDQVIVAGTPRNVEAGYPIYLDDQLVRLELQVRG